MRKIKSSLHVVLLLILVTASFHALAAPGVHDSYKTKFGLLTQNYPSTNFLLDGKLFLRAPEKKDAYGFDVNLSYETFGWDSTGNGDSFLIKRIIVAYNGGGGGCNRQFVVMDFTGSAPYISKPFGYNPDGTACLEFKKVKWGKDVSYIYLEGPMKYAYHTGGAVVGPLE